LKVSSSAVATRNPRLIMVVIDRSASMLAQGGGASGLPPAIVQFLDFFDTSSDNIGIVSFGSSARLEMPLTTNFLIAGTNNLINAYQTNAAGQAEPGVDPESDPNDPFGRYDPNYNSTGIRRLKFGGDTAADDGIRLGLEQLMANSGFTDPDVVKYMVIFTDGKWNASRTLVAAPGYTNVVAIPPVATLPATNFFAPAYTAIVSLTNGQESITKAGVVYYPWQPDDTTNFANNANIIPVPTLSPLPGLTNALAQPAAFDFATLVGDHTSDTWLSADGINEPFHSPSQILGGSVTPPVSDGALGTTPKQTFTHYLDVWLQPGAVDYLYHGGGISNNGTAVYVSDYTNPTKHISIYVNSGDSNVLIVPGYIADGVVYDGLDLDYPDNVAYTQAGLNAPGFPAFRDDNFQEQYMWPDDTGGIDPNDQNFYSSSLERQLMFRNYVNLLTGFYVFRPDEPNGPGTEPLITDQTNSAGAVGAPRARYGLGAYYPSAGFYWPFGGDQTNSADADNAFGYVTNAVGVDNDPVNPEYSLALPTSGGVDAQRHSAYSINMLSSNAAPEWYGELFYKSVSGGGVNNVSGTGNTAASKIMQSADWQVGAPSFVTAYGGISGLMVSEATHNTTIVGSPSVWRPACFNGSAFDPKTSESACAPGLSTTGGWVSDGNGHFYPNAMAYSGRPTHYFDFSQSKWIPIADNHTANTQFLQMGTWKSEEYAWHARALGVTIYTVGYGTLVTPAQCLLLAQIANSTNTVSISGGSNIAFNPSQPIGAQFFATNAADISTDFFSVGQAINAALTQ
jgi:hypothetical protein